MKKKSNAPQCFTDFKRSQKFNMKPIKRITYLVGRCVVDLRMKEGWFRLFGV